MKRISKNEFFNRFGQPLANGAERMDIRRQASSFNSLLGGVLWLLFVGVLLWIGNAG